MESIAGIAGIAVIVGLISSIIFYFKSRKARKTLAKGECPACQGQLEQTKLNNEDVKICPKKCGFAGANDYWMTVIIVKAFLGKEADMSQEEVSESNLTKWMAYQKLK